MTAAIPEDRRYLLDDPNYGALGTVRGDGSPQVNPMWFQFDGERIRFTHTTKRAKFRNLERNPAMTFMVFDPGNPYRYIELRGHLSEVIDDPDGDFFVQLARRYGNESPQPPADAASRVILVMEPTWSRAQ